MYTENTSRLSPVFEMDLARDYFQSNLEFPPDPLQIAKRSLQRLDAEGKPLASLKEMLDRFPMNDLLVSREEWKIQLACVKKFLGLEKFVLHVSFGSPVMFPGQVSIAALLKLYSDDEKQLVRIKTSAFLDQDHQLWWEVGFVHRDKTIQSDRYLNGTDRNSYYLLSELVKNTFEFSLSRSSVKGIHLSPAYYHVLPLSRRIASLYPNHLIEKPGIDWERKFSRALLTCGGSEYSKLPVSHKKFYVSRLLHQGLLKDPETGEKLTWEPPAVIILK